MHAGSADIRILAYDTAYSYALSTSTVAMEHHNCIFWYLPGVAEAEHDLSDRTAGPGRRSPVFLQNDPQADLGDLERGERYRGLDSSILRSLSGPLVAIDFSFACRRCERKHIIGYHDPKVT